MTKGDGKEACAYVESFAAFPHMHRRGDGRRNGLKEDNDLSEQKYLDRGAPLRQSNDTSTRKKGAMKSEEKWLRKPQHNPPISQDKAGFGTYSFLKCST
jgi:hypothetical protein